MRATNATVGPMRVCVLNDNYYRSSGVAIAIRRIVQQVPDVDFLFAGCDAGGLAEELSWMPAGSFKRFDLKTSNPATVVRELTRLKRWLKQRGCDLVHCHHRRLAVLLRLARIPAVYTAHAEFPPVLWFRLLGPLNMTAVTPSIAKSLKRATGRTVLACIGNPVAFPDSPPAPNPERSRKRAICVGRLEPIKGHKYLLQAWKLLHDKGLEYELDLLGEGSLEPELKQQCAQDGTQALVRFLGFREDVTPVVSRCLFAILLSECEGQGIVTLEAAALGLPSLLTGVSGSIDLLPPDRTLVNGLRFGDVEGTAAALESWFAQPEQVEEEGRLFFRFLKQSSDPATVGRKYREVYRTVLERAGREPA